MFLTHICGLFGQYFDLPRIVREHEEGQLGFEREETWQVWRQMLWGWCLD